MARLIFPRLAGWLVYVSAVCTIYEYCCPPPSLLSRRASSRCGGGGCYFWISEGWPAFGVLVIPVPNQSKAIEAMSIEGHVLS